VGTGFISLLYNKMGQNRKPTQIKHLYIYNFRKYADASIPILENKKSS